MDLSKPADPVEQAAARAYIEKVFRAHRLEDECWIAPNKPQSNGFVAITYRGQRAYLHRLAHWAAHGAISEQLRVYPTCGDRRCANWNHTAKQTTVQVAQRMKEEGLQASGLQLSIAITAGLRHRRKYSDEVIAQARSCLASGKTSKEVSEQLPISKAMVDKLRGGKVRRGLAAGAGVSVFTAGGGYVEA